VPGKQASLEDRSAYKKPFKACRIFVAAIPLSLILSCATFKKLDNDTFNSCDRFLINQRQSNF